MSVEWLPILEGLLIVGLVFGFGFWELSKLKRERRQRTAEKNTEQAE